MDSFPSELSERYKPLRFLGEDDLAKVFKVRRRKDRKIVALKILNIYELYTDENTKRAFVEEIPNGWLHLNHPNIVQLYDVKILPVPYLEMEFTNGQFLDRHSKTTDEKTALKIVMGIAQALKHAHSRGIVQLFMLYLTHGDPEHFDEETYGEPDHRTDIYQIGLILYELLTGELPYRATSPGALFWKIIQAKPKPVSELRPELKKFEGMFERLLAKEKGKRYQSVEEFLSALDSLWELENEKEELRKTSLAMRKSRSRKEFERLKVESVRKTVKIALLSARLNDKAELLVALDDLKFYTRENLDDLLSAIEQVELLLKEGIPIGPEVEERLRALVLRVEGEFGGFELVKSLLEENPR